MAANKLTAQKAQADKQKSTTTIGAGLIRTTGVGTAAPTATTQPPSNTK